MRWIPYLFPLIFGGSASGQLRVALTASPPGAQFVGTPVTFSANVDGVAAGAMEYRFTWEADSRQPRLLRDFHASNQATWAPLETEGTYTVRVTARNRTSGEQVSAASALTVLPRASGAAAVVSPTANPLVAIFSAPPCPAGSEMYVQFGQGAEWSRTNSDACGSGSTMNFYIAGMLASTTYQMNAVVVTAGVSQASPPVSFTTGPLDPLLAFPPTFRFLVPDARTSAAEKILLLDYLSPPGGPYYCPTAVDLEGRVLWYYPLLATPAQNTTYFLRPAAGTQGHMFLIANDPTSTPDQGQMLREIDLAGNTVAETTAARVSEQLQAQGKLGIIDFDHEALRLPNGHTLVLGSQERIFPTGTQGFSTTVDILGSAIVDLDENWQVAWSWSGFDHLDINRAAVLNETCSGQPGCPQLTLAAAANDWLHANSLSYVPETGAILLSIRHQDWIVKVDYADGSGDGGILWRLGPGGDFAMLSSDPHPWFSHQHDAHFEDANGTLALFDNGNTRVRDTPGNSRGYVLRVDEANRAVEPLLLADLGVYSAAVGSAARLQNGNYHFEAGNVRIPDARAYAMEVLPDGTPNVVIQAYTQTYRSYRMPSLYMGSAAVER